MSTLKVNTVQHNSSGFSNVVQFTDGSGTQNGTLCRAWVNFNGQGTIAIRDDFNVNSLTDVGTGLHTVNFANAMPDVNYSTVLANQGVDASDNSLEITVLSYNNPPTASNFTIATAYPNSSQFYDCAIHTAAVFR